ncbi:MAG: hypothetical protein II448_05080 [Paludibacteraceae bacterium]|nr:hypothetical protein [Paludibacteraceae bacterium]MBR6118185.1 hypothetical protein [Paludibacteraceae bacterium]
MKKLAVLFLSIVSVAAMMTSCLTPEQKMQKSIEAANKECPMDLGGGLTMASVTGEDNNLISTFEVNEETMGISVKLWNMPEVKDAMKKSMVELYKNGSNKDVAELSKMCKEANYNLVFRFEGKPSGEVVEITVNADEL